jgi:hypothetical protein
MVPSLSVISHWCHTFLFYCMIILEYWHHPLNKQEKLLVEFTQFYRHMNSIVK